MATEKELFVGAALQLAQKILQVMDEAPSVVSQYFDAGYNGGGADPIIDLDLTGGFNALTAAEVTNLITALQQIENYFNNAAVLTGDYSVTYNALRYVRST